MIEGSARYCTHRLLEGIEDRLVWLKTFARRKSAHDATIKAQIKLIGQDIEKIREHLGIANHPSDEQPTERRRKRRY